MSEKKILVNITAPSATFTTVGTTTGTTLLGRDVNGLLTTNISSLVQTPLTNPVTASTSSFTANALIKATGTGNQVMATGISVDASNNISNVGTITGTSFNSITGLATVTPLINGTAAVGTSSLVARQDHIHASDTTKANLTSPTFTGVPLAPTATVNTNTTQIATTAFVMGQGYLLSTAYTASDVLTKIKTVDGAGSGLDADLLGGSSYTLIKKTINSVTNNLGTPSVEEMALFQGQFSNKLRFIKPNLQEESTDGITWVTSARASDNILGDLMLGEGQGTSFSAIPAPVVGSPGGAYRLTWNTFGYVFLNALYIYCSTSGNTINFKIEAYHNTNGWVAFTNGNASNWPGHVYVPHTYIPFSTAPTQYGMVRITFQIVTASQANPFTLAAIEWFGGYPAGRRNVEFYDRDKTVYFPNEMYLKADTGIKKVWHEGNDGAGSGLDADTLDGQHLSYLAPIASPAMTGVPTVPTAAPGTNTTQISSTAFVRAAIAETVTSVSGGSGMNFTTITTTGSIILGTPTQLTAATTDAVTANSHTHSILSNVVASSLSNGTTNTVGSSAALARADHTHAISGFVTTDTNYYPTTFTWTNGSTSGPTGALTGTGMSAVSYAAIPSASATISGIVTTSSQTFVGAKTFNTQTVLAGGYYTTAHSQINSDYILYFGNSGSNLGVGMQYVSASGIYRISNNNVSPLPIIDINTSTLATSIYGNLVLNQQNIDVTSTLSANSSFTGIIETGTVGEAVVFGDVLYLKFSDGKWWKAKADAYATTPATRMALGSISANGSGSLLIEGNVRYDSWSLGVNKIYLSAATAGAVTTTVPSTTGNQIQTIGTAKTSTTMYFRPSLDVGEV